MFIKRGFVLRFFGWVGGSLVLTLMSVSYVDAGPPQEPIFMVAENETTPQPDTDGNGVVDYVDVQRHADVGVDLGITYPRFRDSPHLNDYITSRVEEDVAFFDELVTMKTETIESLADECLRNAADDYYDYTAYLVVYHSADVTSLRIEYSSYYGAAHGVSSVSLLSLLTDDVNVRPLSYQDIFVHPEDALQFLCDEGKERLKCNCHPDIYTHLDECSQQYLHEFLITPQELIFLINMDPWYGRGAEVSIPFEIVEPWLDHEKPAIKALSTSSGRGE